MFWGVTIESGKRYSQIVESSYHLSMAALEPNCKEATNRFVSVMIEHGKTEFLLCTLEYDRIMQVPLDLLFIEGEEVSFFLNGEGVVHLTGYVTDNEDKTAALSSDQSNEESENLSEESELSDQEDISCSKLMALDSDSESTGEEWTPEKALSKKRKKLSTRSNIPKLQSLEEKKPQKPDKEPKSYSKTVSGEKSKNSKQKTNQTVKNDISVSTVSSDLESDEEIEDDEDEEEEVDLDEEDEEESEDEDEESEEDSDDDKNKSDSLTKNKIGSRDASIVSPKQTLNPSAFKKGLNKMSPHNESRSSNANASKSIETPASKKKQETSFKRKADDNLQRETPSGNKICHTPPKTINEVPTSSSGKKKRKRSLKKDENSSFSESSKKDTPSMKLQNGIKITDIKQGNGPQAKKGKFVHVCYVGKLNSGVKFDSVEDRPFSFRLGCGEVIKGLDTGIEGMKVGGKRKVVIPPVQGYGNKKVGPIPPNSTLQFEVELKAVS